ncbi:MAG: hypothetical protein KAX15_04915, partial [Candidatus Omnitrophica bacterium]|nr:hypothetical protein [Candidatus Omnitrophota bacterium]
GLWEDALIFDEKTYETIGWVVIETITSPVCMRGMTLEYNLNYAGKTEMQVYPDEFTERALKIKKKYAKKWAHKVLKFYPVKDKKGFSGMMFSGNNPNKLIRPQNIERQLYRPGFLIEKNKQNKTKSVHNFLSFTLNEERLNLTVVNKYRNRIIDYCQKYSKSGNLKIGRKLIPFNDKGFFKNNNLALSDGECLKIYRKLKKTCNTFSNRVFINIK